MAELEVRRVRPDDADLLTDFYRGLSRESLRARFLGQGTGIADAAARTFCTLDHVHDEGFVAVAAQRSKAPSLVGHVCLVECAPDALELGIAVADDWQGQGIGRRLFEVALAWASRRGYQRIIATCFADNSRVLRLLTSAPLPPTIDYAGCGVVDVSIPLAPLGGDAGAGRTQRRQESHPVLSSAGVARTVGRR